MKKILKHVEENLEGVVQKVRKYFVFKIEVFYRFTRRYYDNTF
jgi:hypothetical protein